MPLLKSVSIAGLKIGLGVADMTLGTLVANLGYGSLEFTTHVALRESGFG